VGGNLGGKLKCKLQFWGMTPCPPQKRQDGVRRTVTHLSTNRARRRVTGDQALRYHWAEPTPP